ncbi:hypothetical protein [Marinobacter sp. X15-166B]|uniref:hypothetical protein n=1 Tax=Marinobacter sp. X15-166B TaxID=1897620 RepID=UPI00085BDB21|nr:hypothetical protein [Marinobacter sp. X15-166B]OEY66486.1 hypothetical protein BG841_08470 [Marinobacter sp. X15-166B]
MSKLKAYQQQLQDIVEKGINAAEERQKKLSAKPFEFAEKLEADVREYSVQGLRNRYYGCSENVFERLRKLNGRFGNFAADLIARLEKDVQEGADAVVEVAEDLQDAVSADTPAAPKTKAKKASGNKKTATRKESAPA